MMLENLIMLLDEKEKLNMKKPDVDIFITDEKKLCFNIALPGWEEEDLTVFVNRTNRIITVAGEIAEEKLEKVELGITKIINDINYEPFVLKYKISDKYALNDEIVSYLSDGLLVISFEEQENIEDDEFELSLN